MSQSLKAWKRTLTGATFGIVLFLLHNTAVWSGATSAVPLFHLRSPDTSEYLGFLTLASNHFLFPNLHMAWRTEPAMFHPLFLTGGRIGSWLGFSPVLTLKILEALLLIWVGIVLMWVLDVFLKTRAQRIGAIVAALLTMPLTMFLLGAPRLLAHSVSPLFFLGVIELSYSSADGLLRGGLSNSPTLSFGTSMMLASLGLAAARLETGQRVFSWLLVVAAFFSALVHPFEVFVIVPAVFAGFLWLERKAWRELIPIALAAGLGFAPQLYLVLHHPWMSDMTQSFDTDMDFSRLIIAYGFGFLAVPFLLMAKALPRTKPDKLLLLWWGLTVAISVTPGAPFPPHLLNGFSVVTGILIVRLAASDPKLNLVFQNHRTACLAALGCVLVLGGFAYGGMYVQLARDGRSLEPQFLLNASAGEDEMAVFREFQRLGREDDLVLAPEAISLLLIRAPIHSFASHQHLSLDYYRQQADVIKFFDHKMTGAEADALLNNYGIHWVVVPEESKAIEYLRGSRPSFRHGHLQVFEIPGNQIKAYPGLAVIDPAGLHRTGVIRRVLQVLHR
jgi:hypothetical protein